MMRKFSLVIPLVVVAPLSAQIGAQAEYSLTFREVDAVSGLPVAHPNGVVEPGEGALISLAVSFYPSGGTVVPNPSFPPGTWRTHAFRGSIFPGLMINGGIVANGSWSGLQNDWGAPGQPSMDGSQVEWISLIQPFAETADQRNPAENIWRGIWVPDDYTARTVNFALSSRGTTGLLGDSTLWLRDDGPPETYIWAIPTDVWVHRVFIEIGPGPGPCYANCDASTTEPKLTVDDFTCFINEFAAALVLPYEQQVEHYANCDGSTTVPVLTVDDFTCFINEFAAGCP